MSINKTLFQQQLDELKRAGNERRFNELQSKYQSPETIDYSNMSLRDELQTRFDLDELNRLSAELGKENTSNKEYNDKYRGYIDKYLPDSFVQSYDTLNNAKEQMEKVNRIGADNYYHSVAMCENAKAGRPLSSLLLGLAKEGYDVVNKYGNKPLGEIISDSSKDMKNNMRGIYYGLKYPDKNCDEIFKNLDWVSNKMY